jgi:uncharacterized protein (DUF433 family)
MQLWIKEVEMAVEKVVDLKQIDWRLGRLEQEVRELQGTLWRPDLATSEHPLIIRRPGVCGGEAAIAGTRTPVRAIVEHVRVGDTVEDILEHLPYLTREQIHAALDYYRQHKLEIDSSIELNDDEGFWRAWVSSQSTPTKT